MTNTAARAKRICADCGKCNIDFFMQSGYNRKEKCNKLQKSFAEEADSGDSQRFLFE